MSHFKPLRAILISKWHTVAFLALEISEGKSRGHTEEIESTLQLHFRK